MERLAEAGRERQALQAVIDQLREENAGLKRQRTRLLEEAAVASEQNVRAIAGVGRGGIFPPGEELACEQGTRREALERIAKLEVLLHESRGKLSQRDETCKREEKLRQEATQTIESLQKKVANMQKVIESVDVSISEVTDPDGGIDPVRLVLNLARMALPCVDHRGDPNLAIAQLEVAAKDAERPSLMPGIAALAAPLPPQPLPPLPMTFHSHSAAVPPAAALVHFAQAAASGSLQVPPQAHAPRPASWSTTAGLHASGAGPTLGWPPTPPPPKTVILQAAEAEGRMLYRGALPLQSVT